MKMKEFGPPGGGARPWRPPLDPPMAMYKSLSPKIASYSNHYSQTTLPFILVLSGQQYMLLRKFWPQNEVQ